MSGEGEDFDRWRARGDASALARVFDAQAPALMRFAVHLVGDANAAEDLVQETFVTALRRAAQYDAARPIERWLAGILARHAQELRRDARRIAPQAPPELVHERTPLDDARTAEEREVVARALDRLEEPYRSAAVLHVVHGLTAAEIAHALDRSPGAVRVQLHRARELLRQMLPIGIAGALALIAEPARGMEAVRDAVLARASQLTPAAVSTAGVVGGILVMKKLVAAAVLVLVLAGAWWWSARPELDVGGTRAVAALPMSVEDPSASRAVVMDAARDPDAERAPVALDPPASATGLQPFPVRVVDGDTGAPVAGARLAFFAPKRSLWSEVRARWPDRFDEHALGFAPTHDWPWFRAKLTTPQRLGLDPVVSYESPPEGETPLATSISDASGKAIVDLAPDHAFVVAECEGYVGRGLAPILERVVRWRDATKYDEKTFRDDALVVKLFRPRVVRGQLVGTDGERLRRVVRLQVEGVADGDPLPGGHHTQDPVGAWTVTTDADGTFELVVGAPRVKFRALETGWFVTRSGIHPERRERWVYPQVHPAGDAVLTWVAVRRNPVVVVRSATDGAPVRDFALRVDELSGFGTHDFVRRIRAEDGRVRLLEDYELENEGNKVGPLTIRVAAAGFEPGAVECADPLRADEILVALRPGACPTVTGRVLDDGRPVAGATCLVAPGRKGGWSCEADRAEFATTTDADGRFAACLPPGGWVVVVEHAERTRCRFVEHPSDAEVEIEFARDTVIDVVVDIDSDQPPAKLSAQIQSGRDVGQSLQVDASGHARFGSLPPGRYTVRVHRDNDSEIAAAPGDAEFELAADTTRTARFPGALSTPERHARLVVDGLARLDGWKAVALRVGAEPVAVEPDGRVPFDCRAGVGVRVEDPDGRSYQFRVSDVSGEPQLRVARGRGSFRGTVRRADGAPDAGGKVIASFRADEHGLQRVACPIDRDGAFVVDALPPDARHLSVADARGSESRGGFDGVWFVSASAPAADGTELAIVLPAGIYGEGARIALHGFARNASGPATGRELRVRARLEQSGGTLFVSNSAVVLSDGSYVLVTVPAPAHVAMCWLERGPPPWELEFTLPADGPSARQDFDLR